MFPTKCPFSLVFTVLLAVCVGTTGAQDAEDFLDYGESGEELVITAGRISEALKTVPAQVTVITADDIAQSGASSVAGVLETVPGVRFSGGVAGSGSETISMRGFGENSYGRVLILVDGNKINDPDMKAVNWNAIPLADIERIEVLDGSAGVLYGNNAVGGVINIITKKGGKKRTSIGIAAGSFFYNRGAFSHFEPFSWGNISVSAEHSGTQGYRQRQSSQVTNLAGSTTVFIGDTMQLSFNGFFSDLYYQLPGGLSKEEFEKDPKQALTDDGSTWPVPHYLFNGGDENFEYHFGGGLSFRWFPAENVELMLPLSYRGKSINSDMASYMYGGGYTDRSVHSAEVRPQGSVTFDAAGMPLRLLGGIDFYFTRLGADIYDDGNRTQKSNSFVISEWTIGPYLTARFSPLSNLSVSAGARFDTAIIKAENRNGSADGNKTFTAFIYDAGIVYNPLDELKLYARYAALFRYPFVDELAQVSGYADKFNTDLKPEKGFNAEAGASYQWENYLNVSANFFFMQLEDEIGFNNNTKANENLDETRRFGTNVSLYFNPVALISLDLSYTMVNAVFTDGGNKDKRVPLVPEHKVYGSIMMHLPFGLSFGPDFEYISSCYYGQDFTNESVTMDAYFLLGARVRFVLDKERNHFAFQITAKNLLGSKYAAYGTYYKGDEWGTPPSHTLYPADGRSVNVSLQYRF